MCETVFVHESGEMLECGIVHFPAVKQDPQGYASALTYARRYSLMAACGIAPEDDDGPVNNPKIPPPTTQPIVTDPPPITITYVPPGDPVETPPPTSGVPIYIPGLGIVYTDDPMFALATSGGVFRSS